jgi:hypothetical protein
MESSGPGGEGAESPRITGSSKIVLSESRGNVSISPLYLTLNAPSVRDSRLSSCQSSVEKMVFRAWRIRDSIGASSGTGLRIVDDPVFKPSTWTRTRTDCGSVLETP